MNVPYVGGKARVICELNKKKCFDASICTEQTHFFSSLFSPHRIFLRAFAAHNFIHYFFTSPDLFIFFHLAMTAAKKTKLNSKSKSKPEKANAKSKARAKVKAATTGAKARTKPLAKDTKVKLTPVVTDFNDAENARLRKMIQEGASIGEVAADLGATAASVRKQVAYFSKLAKWEAREKRIALDKHDAECEALRQVETQKRYLPELKTSNAEASMKAAE